MTIVELLLSVILISLVLIFIIQICLRARNAYLNNTINVKYELSKSVIIDTVMSDLIKNNVSNIYVSRNGSTDNIIFDYSGINKKLSISNSGDNYIIKYETIDDNIYNNIEMAREYKKSEVIYGGISEYNLSYSDNHLKKYRINLTGTDGYDYSINLYCPY